MNECKAWHKKIWVKITSIILVITFLNQDIIWAEASLNTIHISKSLAQSKTANAGTNGKTIINIQDAHASIGAQESIVSILDALVTNYDLKLIALEGSRGYIDTSILKTIPDENIKKETANYLMSKGRISAGELFSIMSNRDVKLIGIEDEHKYKKNLDAFRKVFEINKDISEDIANLKSALDEIKDKVYSDDIKRLESNYELNEKGRVHFSDRWRFDSYLAEKAGLDNKAYGNLTKLAASLDMEKDIDFKSANKEREALMGELSERLPKKEIEAALLKSLSYKTGKMSPGEYHSSLKELTERNGINIGKYKHLSKYTEYISLYETIDLLELFNEIRIFEEAIIRKLLKTPEEKDLYEYLKYFRLINSLFSLKLSNSDYEYIKNIQMKPEDMLSFMRRMREERGMAVKEDFDISKIFKNIPEALSFYRVAEERNARIIANTIQAMGKDNVSVAALVTGGFHSKGIADILRKREASCVIILPKYDESKGQRPYAAILTNKNDISNEYCDGTKYEIVADERLKDVELLKEAIVLTIGQAAIEKKNIAETKRAWMKRYYSAYHELIRQGVIHESDKTRANNTNVKEADKAGSAASFGSDSLALPTSCPEAGKAIHPKKVGGALSSTQAVLTGIQKAVVRIGEKYASLTKEPSGGWYVSEAARDKAQYERVRRRLVRLAAQGGSPADDLNKPKPKNLKIDPKLKRRKVNKMRISKTNPEIYNAIIALLRKHRSYIKTMRAVETEIDGDIKKLIKEYKNGLKGVKVALFVEMILYPDLSRKAGKGEELPEVMNVATAGFLKGPPMSEGWKRRNVMMGRAQVYSIHIQNSMTFKHAADPNIREWYAHNEKVFEKAKGISPKSRAYIGEDGEVYYSDKGTGFIGNYEVVDTARPSYDSGTNTLSGRLRDMTTGRIIDLKDAKIVMRAPPEEIKDILEIVRSKANNKLIGEIITEFDNNFNGEYLVINHPSDPALSFAAQGLICVSGGISRNQLSVFHEAAHYVFGQTRNSSLLKLVEEYLIKEHRLKYEIMMRKAGANPTDNIRIHYILRALQWAVAGRKDAKLTRKIKSLKRKNAAGRISAGKRTAIGPENDDFYYRRWKTTHNPRRKFWTQNRLKARFKDLRRIYLLEKESLAAKGIRSFYQYMTMERIGIWQSYVIHFNDLLGQDEGYKNLESISAETFCYFCSVCGIDTDAPEFERYADIDIKGRKLFGALSADIYNSVDPLIEEAIDYAFGKLSPRLRLLIIAACSGIPYRNIAEMCEVSEHSVGQHVYEIKRRLRIYADDYINRVAPRDEKGKADSEFIGYFTIGLPRGVSIRHIRGLENAIDAYKMAENKFRIEVFRDKKDYLTKIKHFRERSIFIDLDVISQCGAEDIAADILMAASPFIVGSETRHGLAKAARELAGLLEEIKAFDVDRDREAYRKMLRRQDEYDQAVRELIAERKEELKDAYNNRINEAVKNMPDNTRPLIVASTEAVIESDMYAAENALKGLENGICNSLIYGLGKSKIKTVDKAKEYLRSRGFSGKVVEETLYIDGRDDKGKVKKSNDLIDEIAGRSGVSNKAVGVRAGEGEITKNERYGEDIKYHLPDGIFLEISRIEARKGEFVYSALNSYQAVLALMKYAGQVRKLNSVYVPGVRFDISPGRIIYLPEIDKTAYWNEIMTYREAMRALEQAA